MMKISLIINFTDDAYAVRVLESVSPDNIPLPSGLEIEMNRSGRTLSCIIESTRGLGSLRATLDSEIYSLHDAAIELNGYSFGLFISLIRHLLCDEVPLNCSLEQVLINDARFVPCRIHYVYL